MGTGAMGMNKPKHQPFEYDLTPETLGRDPHEPWGWFSAVALFLLLAVDFYLIISSIWQEIAGK